MRLLVDTHIAYWLTLDPARLSAGESRMLRDAKSAPAYSAVSIWEMRLKWDTLYAPGERKGPASPDTVLTALRLINWRELPLTADDAATELHVAIGHKDPFDELLVAQAQRHDLRLLTRDRRLRDHPLVVAG